MALEAYAHEEDQTAEFSGLEHPRKIDFEHEPAHALTIALRATHKMTKDVEIMVERVNAEVIQNIGELAALSREFQAEARKYAGQIDHDAKTRLTSAATEIMALSQAEYVRRIDLIAADTIDSISHAVKIEATAAVRAAFRAEEDHLTLQKRRYNESLVRFDSAVAQLINARQHQVNKGFFRKLFEVFFSEKPLAALLPERRESESSDRRQTGAAK